MLVRAGRRGARRPHRRGRQAFSVTGAGSGATHHQRTRDHPGTAGFTGQLVKGGPEMLLQGVRESEATPIDCVSTGYRLQKIVYQASPVQSVASQSRIGGDQAGPRTQGFFGAVQFATADAARAFFAASADKWHRCNGRRWCCINPSAARTG